MYRKLSFSPVSERKTLYFSAPFAAVHVALTLPFAVARSSVSSVDAGFTVTVQTAVVLPMVALIFALPTPTVVTSPEDDTSATLDLVDVHFRFSVISLGVTDALNEKESPIVTLFVLSLRVISSADSTLLSFPISFDRSNPKLQSTEQLIPLTEPLSEYCQTA